MGTTKKPIFKKWYSGKPPTLQIRILQSIASFGQTSKKKATLDLDANYSDISDAMKALIKRDFIRFSHVNKASRNPEKFYKITADGLKALLSEDKLTPQQFWKAAALLCISSEGNKYESQFLDFYGLHENDFIHVSTNRNLLLSWLFDDILRLWSDINNIGVSADNSRSTPLPQLIIESLAFDGPMSLKKLVEKADAKEEDIVRVLNSYSISLVTF
jgi:DNA-binding MarR family transcriptional regulator